MEKPKLIVLTGGPCAGKTDSIKAIKREYGDRVITAPEMATMFVQAGFPRAGLDITYSDEWLADFQFAIGAAQLGFENQFLAMAEKIGARVVIMDRGLCDSEAYLKDSRPFYERLGMTRDQALARYERVIHLESLAVCRPDLYSTANNVARTEDPDEAKALDYKTRAAWSDHPNWTLIEGKNGIKSVIAQVMKYVSDFVDVEYEYKFLLPGLPKIALPDGVKIRQAYIEIDEGEIRVRSYGDETFLTIKGEGGYARKEQELVCAQWVFDQVWDTHPNTRIEKTRYIVEGGWELDVFEGSLTGLVLAELESSFPLDTVKLPDWATGAVDVTEDDEYKNRRLAVYGKPR